MNGLNKEPRLRFTDEERADPALEKPIRKADKAAAKADKAQAKIPKKQVRQKTVDPETGKVTTKLVLEDKKKPPSKLSHAVRDTPANAALGKVHKEIRETEQDNVGVESAHKSEEAAETGARLVREGYRSHKLKPYAKWRYDDLPILPDHWQMVVSKDKKKQFDVLKQLMNAPDVTEVVNACDAGREGELIFRAVYELAGCQKPMKRLWISSMEDSAIREGFANLRPGADYDGLRDAALCRAKAAWLVGINATRLFSVLYHRTLNIGRVMSPTLALIVQREAEIDTFKPVPFYTVTLELPGFSVSGERMADKVAAQQLKTACQGAAATVKKVERKDKSEKPPALYDLTTLQRDANRLLGFTAQQTLDYLQNLYEKKLCTYPRTDSRYLTSDILTPLPMRKSMESWSSTGPPTTPIFNARRPLKRRCGNTSTGCISVTMPPRA